MFGKLTLEAFQHEESQNMAMVSMVLTGLGLRPDYLFETVEMALE